ncbi:hypothetical protein ACU82A_32220 [Bacillus cereus]
MEHKTEHVIHKLIENGLFFRVNKEVLARHFLNDVLKTNVFELKKRRSL